MATLSQSPEIIPAPGFVLIEPYTEEEESIIHIAGESSSASTQVKGVVLAINQDPYVSEYGGVINPWPQLKVGDVVIHKQYGSEKIIHQDKKYRLVKHVDIVAVIKKV